MSIDTNHQALQTLVGGLGVDIFLHAPERRKKFLVSQAWLEMVESVFPYELRYANRRNESWLSDYTFFFEDDFGLHKGIQDPFCAIVTGMKINPSSGVLFLGMERRRERPAVCDGSILLNGFTYGTECIGSGAHALGLRNSIAAPLIAAVRAIQGISRRDTDMTLFEFSTLFHQSFMLVGSNLTAGPFRGIFYQDRKTFSPIKISNGTL